MSHFSALMREAGRLRDEKGNFEEAIVTYERAKHHVESRQEMAEANCQLGVTLRLALRLDDAEEAFLYALYHVGDEKSALYGRILRDYGMLALDQAVRRRETDKFRTAKGRFGQSVAVYDRLNEITEKAVSRGYLGRAYLLAGDGHEATQIMLSAHLTLTRSKDVAGERDNLVWLARASTRYRWRYALRGLRITFGTRRFKEYVALLLGGESLYAKLAARR